MLNLKVYQHETLSNMLNLQSTTAAGTTSAFSLTSSSLPSIPTQSLHWKVLIYDLPCRDIIAPQFSAVQLREAGVTFHGLISAPREPIAAVPVIYFISPSEENITLIIRDITRQLYEECHFFFTFLPDGFLAHFARRLVNECDLTNNDFSRLCKRIVNLMCDYVCAEDNLISLQHKQSYRLVFGPQPSQNAIFPYLDKIAQSLVTIVFQVFNATKGSLPLIIAPFAPQSPAFYVTKQLITYIHALILAHFNASSISFCPSITSVVAQPRWRLFLCDRNMFFSGALLQSPDYGSLCYELGYQGGSITLPIVPDVQSEAKNVVVDLSYPLWSVNRFHYPYYIARQLNPMLKQYLNEKMRIDHLLSQSKTSGGVPSSSSSSSSATTSSATLQTSSPEQYNTIFSTLPLLTRTKLQLDSHTLLCKVITFLLRKRQLSDVFGMELKLSDLIAKQQADSFAYCGKPPVTATNPTTTPNQPQTSNFAMFQPIFAALTAAQTSAKAALTTFREDPSAFHAQEKQRADAKNFQGVLSPLDRLRLLVNLVISGAPAAALVDLFEALIETCQDQRFPELFHVPVATIIAAQLFAEQCATGLKLQRSAMTNFLFKPDVKVVPIPTSLDASRGGNTGTGNKASAGGMFQSWALPSSDSTEHKPTSGLNYAIVTVAETIDQCLRNPVLVEQSTQRMNFSALQQLPQAAAPIGTTGYILIDPVRSFQAANGKSGGSAVQIAPAALFHSAASTITANNHSNASSGGTNSSQQETLAFVIGGGNYSEYGLFCQNSNATYLNRAAAAAVATEASNVAANPEWKHTDQYDKKFAHPSLMGGCVYGATEMLTPKDFLASLEGCLGRSSPSSSSGAANGVVAPGWIPPS